MRCAWLFLLIAAAGFAQEEKTRPPPAVFVLLLREERRVSSATLTPAASKALGIDFVNAMTDPEKAKEQKAFVMDARPGKVFLIGTPNMLLTVETAPRPLWKDLHLAAQAYPRARRAIRNHKAILTIQAKHARTAKSKEERLAAYRDLAKLTAGLLGDDVLALYAQENAVLALPGARLAEALRDEQPLAQLARRFPSKRVIVPGRDPEMAAAVKKARETFDRFERAFRAGPVAKFAVKLKLESEETEEQIWISVTKIDEGVVHGTLENDPVTIRKKKGDAVSVKKTELLDWLYVTGGKMIGGYTVRLLQKRAQKK